jgi:predicted DNA binding protein
MSQQHEALQIANRVRMDGVIVRQEIAAGILSIAEALDDPRAGHMTIGRVLCSQRRYGPSRAHRMLTRMNPPIWPTRRVRDLTERQRKLIVQALERG